MKKIFFSLILVSYFSGMIFTSQGQFKRPIDLIREARIQFAAQERELEQRKKLQKKEQRAQKLLAYKQAKELWLRSESQTNVDLKSRRKNPTDTQLKKQERGSGFIV